MAWFRKKWEQITQNKREKKKKIHTFYRETEIEEETQEEVRCCIGRMVYHNAVNDVRAIQRDIRSTQT